MVFAPNKAYSAEKRRNGTEIHGPRQGKILLITTPSRDFLRPESEGVLFSRQKKGAEKGGTAPTNKYHHKEDGGVKLLLFKSSNSASSNIVINQYSVNYQSQQLFGEVHRQAYFP
jgi:hypothetical protein